MMKIPVYLEIAQWALLLALGWLVVIMYRQLGRVFGPKQESRHGPAIGSSAPGFEYLRVSDRSVRLAEMGNGQPNLLAFVNPTCQTCDTLVASLTRAHAAGDLAAVRVLLLISDPVSYLQISAAFRETPLEIGQVVARSTINDYQASGTPLVVSVDGNGVIRKAGPAAELSDVRAFVQACVLAPPEKELAIVPVNQGD
jgi:AhpC/TSA family